MKSKEPWPGHRGRGGKRRSWAAGTITNGASGVRKRRGGCCGPRATHASVVRENGVCWRFRVAVSDVSDSTQIRRRRRCLARFLTFVPSLAHLAATKTHNNNCAYPQNGKLTIPGSTCYGDTDGTITIQHKDFYTPHTSIICILRSCA